MNQTQLNTIPVLIAIAAPLAIAWLSVQIQFWFGAVIANPIGLVLALGIGCWMATKVSLKSNLMKGLFLGVYVIACTIAVLSVGLMTSCVNGDCI